VERNLLKINKKSSTVLEKQKNEDKKNVYTLKLKNWKKKAK